MSKYKSVGVSVGVEDETGRTSEYLRISDCAQKLNELEKTIDGLRGELTVVAAENEKLNANLTENRNAYKEIEAGKVRLRNELTQENKKLKDRWETLKDMFQITIDQNEDDSIDLSFCRSVIDEMNKLEGQ